jgi:signal transduction histidine kinase/CheY-like chemotaxis protein
MTDRSEAAPRERVLVVAPTGRDAALTRSVLTEAGLACHACADLCGLCRELDAGAGAVLLTEEALAAQGPGCLADWLRAQPAWSDLPILLLCGDGADSPVAAWAMDLLGNVTVLERPVRVTTLVSAVRAALKARRRQYELRDQMDAVREGERRLRRAKDELEEVNRRKDEFLATLAHELRNPLAPIRNAVQILALRGSPDPEAARVREMIGRQVNQLVRLVDDLLDLSRIGRGKLTLRKDRVAVQTVIQQAVETSAPLIEAGRHRLTVDDGPETVYVLGDEVRLTQVVSNLLNNAAKYTPEGGHIRLTVIRDGGEAVIRVADDGVGIPADMLPRVFEMFVQEDRSLGRSQGGLGLGLTLVRRLVELHDGTVTAHSEGPGRGSAFVVRLPVASTGKAVARPAANGQAAHAGPGRRVLVVDDNADAADSLSVLLSLSGHDVRTAHDGPAAVRQVRAFRPEVVLLDIGMPGMDGYQTARAVRELQEGQDVYLVALTGWGQEEDRRRTERAGFDTHLVKPVDHAVLQQLLTTA